MPYMQNNNFNSNSGGDAKKKRNFKVGRIYGSDGQLDVGIYVSDTGGVFGTASIKLAIGKNSNGVMTYENGLNKDNPSVLLNTESTIALLKAFENATDADIAKFNFVHDTGKSKIGFYGSETDIKISVENKVGTKTITLNSLPVGPRNVHASFFQFIEYLKTISKKQLNSKLNPDESAENDDNGDLPI